MQIGSIAQVGKHPEKYRTPGNAKVVIVTKQGLNKYKLEGKRDSALHHLDIPKLVKKGDLAGQMKTPREILAHYRHTPFKQGEKRSSDFNCKKLKKRGTLSRSPTLLNKAYANKQQQSVYLFATENKLCNKKKLEPKSKSKAPSRRKRVT